jgi:hypothetical protein
MNLGRTGGTKILGVPSNTRAAPEHLLEIHVVRLDNAIGGAFTDHLGHPVHLGIDYGVESESPSQNAKVLGIHRLVDRTEGTVGLAWRVAIRD